MTLETNATLSAFSKLVGFFAGVAGGMALGAGLASLIRLIAPGIHPLLWFVLAMTLFVLGLIGGLFAVVFGVDFVWSHITAECPAPTCEGRVHPLRTNIYRCDRCGETHRSRSTGGSEFLPIVRRVEARIEHVLHLDRRGSVSVVQPGTEGSLSDPSIAKSVPRKEGT